MANLPNISCYDACRSLEMWNFREASPQTQIGVRRLVMGPARSSLITDPSQNIPHRKAELNDFYENLHRFSLQTALK